MDVLGPIAIVLGDANVLYRRMLRDHLVYGSDQGAIAQRWNREILDGVVEHLAENIVTFTPEQGDLLIRLYPREFRNDVVRVAAVSLAPPHVPVK